MPSIKLDHMHELHRLFFHRVNKTDDDARSKSLSDPIPISIDSEFALTHGKDMDTIIITADKIPKIFPQKGAMLHAHACGAKAAKIMRVSDAAALNRMGIDETMVVKFIRNEYTTWMESRINIHVWKLFKRAKKLDACSVHPVVCSINVIVPGSAPGNSVAVRPGGAPGNRVAVDADSRAPLLPMRRYETTAARYVRLKDATGEIDNQKRITKIARDVMVTLSVLHKNDIIHLDVKPSNILVPFDYEKSNTAKCVLADYEMACNDGDLMARMIIAPNKRIAIGTPGFMSPLLTKTVSANFRHICKSVGVVYNLKDRVTTTTVCDLHSMALTLANLAGVNRGGPTEWWPPFRDLLRQLLTASSATEIRIKN